MEEESAFRSENKYVRMMMLDNEYAWKKKVYNVKIPEKYYRYNPSSSFTFERNLKKN